MNDASVYGLMAEFDSPQELLDAAHKTHHAGYKKIDAYSPFPVEGLADAIGFHKNYVSLVVLICGIIGGLSGYLLQYYVAVITYPLRLRSTSGSACRRAETSIATSSRSSAARAPSCNSTSTWR